jgi:hypothetical protein
MKRKFIESDLGVGLLHNGRQCPADSQGRMMCGNSVALGYERGIVSHGRRALNRADPRRIESGDSECSHRAGQIIQVVGKPVHASLLDNAALQYFFDRLK